MIRKASLSDIETVRNLFVEYQRWLKVDLCFQSFERELAELPGCYSEPKGAIVVADIDGTIVGCAALRPYADAVGEIKRFYVKPEYQCRGIGSGMLEFILQTAKDSGYNKVILDTLPMMEKAKSLYLKFGFVKTEPYYHNPIKGVEYYQKSIRITD